MEHDETAGTEVMYEEVDGAVLSRIELQNPAFIKPLAKKTVPLTGGDVYEVAQPSTANPVPLTGSDVYGVAQPSTADDIYDNSEFGTALPSNTRRFSRRESYEHALVTVGKHEASAPAAPQSCERFAVCFPSNSE